MDFQKISVSFFSFKRDKLKRMRMESSEKGYTSKNISVMGNTVFNRTVQYKSSFFEKMIKPMIEELIMSDKRIGSKYMIMSLEAHINSLKLVMKRDFQSLSV